MSGRKLTQSEARIWKKVSQTVTPRRKGGAKAQPQNLSGHGTGRDAFAAMLRVPPIRSSQSRALPKTLELNQDKSVRRGRVNIDAKIDLHDMTQSQAREALIAAIIRASNRNLKSVLVVTGKGRQLDGVLRRNFPDWINTQEIRPLIATYAQAHIRHGGSGAWYVFLKTS